MALNDDIIDSYRDQLGRDPTAAEIAAATARINGGASLTDLEQGLNRSLEGQNFDTQSLTSLYRQLFARNPEQEGYQYWLSQMQQDANRDSDVMRQYLIDAASAMDAEAYARSGSAPLRPGGYTQFTSADVEADPYSGRYATTSIYDLAPDAVNVSDIYGTRAQFVNPLNEAAVISNISGEGAWRAQQGLDVLDNEVVRATINRALDSGAMSRDEFNTLTTDLRAARNMDDVRAAFNKPVATVMLDAQYGLQTGQGNTVAEAQSRANDMQRVLDALDSQYYPSNMAVVAPAAAAAGVDYAFGPSAYQGYNTMMTQEDVVTPANFQTRVNNVLTGLGALTPYTQRTFNRTQPTVTVPQTYADRALLGARAPGGVDLAAAAQAAPATFGGVAALPARPATNTSVPEGMAEPTVEGIMANQAAPAPGMRKGGIAALAKQGRHGDTMLAHITPEEARMLKAHGGSGTINPKTGLPEFWKIPGLYQLEKASRPITRPVRKLVEPILPMVKYIAPFIPGIGMPMAVGLGALASGMEGGHGFNLKKGIMGGITAYGMSNIAAGLENAGAQASMTGADATAEQVASQLGGGATAAPGSQAAMLAEQTAGMGQAGVQNIASYARPSAIDLVGPASETTAGMTDAAPSFLDQAKAYTSNLGAGDKMQGLKNLAGIGTDQAATDAARAAFTNKVGMGTAATVIGAGSMDAALAEQEKMKAEQQAILDEKERKRREAADRAYAAMTATPWRFADGGDISYDDSPGIDGMAAGGSPIVAKYDKGGNVEEDYINRMALEANIPESYERRTRFSAMPGMIDVDRKLVGGRLGADIPVGKDTLSAGISGIAGNLGGKYGAKANAVDLGYTAKVGPGILQAQIMRDLANRQNSYRANYAIPFAEGGQPRFLSGGGDGMSDSIPANIEGKQEARLADGEFVIPADVVSHLGNGSSKAGAKRLYSMMDKVRQARTGTKKQGKEINAMKYLPA